MSSPSQPALSLGELSSRWHDGSGAGAGGSRDDNAAMIMQCKGTDADVHMMLMVIICDHSSYKM